MFTLPILPPTIAIPLDEVRFGDKIVARFPGVTAVAKTMGIEELAAWQDAFPNIDGYHQAATRLVFEYLVQIDGLLMAGSEGSAVPFDPANAEHRRSLPAEMRTAIYRAIMDRAAVGEVLEKNSGSPSGSDGTSDTATSSADAASSGSATS